MAQAQLLTRATRGDSLPDILERVLNTGVVIAGDLKIKIADVELLSIQIRLVVCSVEKAKELGIRWWWQEPEPSPPGTRTVPRPTPQSASQEIPPPATPWEAYQAFRKDRAASDSLCRQARQTRGRHATPDPAEAGPVCGGLGTAEP